MWCCTVRGRCQADMPVASFNFGWVVGRGSNSDNATSPDEAINHGRHSENISVVDDTRENVRFDGVWYTQRRKTQISWWFGLHATKFSEYFIGRHRYDAIWRKNASISFKLLFHRWDGGDGCWSHPHALSQAGAWTLWQVMLKCMCFCIICKHSVVDCAAVYLYVRKWPVRFRQFRYPNGVK